MAMDHPRHFRGWSRIIGEAIGDPEPGMDLPVVGLPELLAGELLEPRQSKPDQPDGKRH